MERTQVLIAGAGPSGLMLASELRLGGVEVIVVEPRLELFAWSRSMFMQNRTAEVLEQRGLTWFTEARRWTAYNFGFLNMTRLRNDAEFVPRYAPQRLFEKHLEERSIELGADVRRGQSVVGFTQDDDGVTVEVQTDAGTQRIRALYLVGCDGGRSSVRKLAGIDFPGTESTLHGMTADVTLEEESRYPQGIRADIYPRGLFAVARFDAGTFRVTSIEFESELPPRGTPVTVENLRESVRRVAGRELEIATVKNGTHFGNATRLAERYRVGRVFLAGDAAHVHFISAAQGLNTGIQDAINLGWKLVAAVRGHAEPDLLDSYEVERRPVARRVCMYSQTQVALYHPLQRVGPLRELLSDLMKTPDVSQHLLDLATGIGICYSMEYPGRPMGDHPLLGKRVPDATLVDSTGPGRLFDTLKTGHGVVLDLSGTGVPGSDVSGWADRVVRFSAQPVPELPAAVLLIRPDGYVAHVDPDGTDAAGLKLALHHWFGPPTPVEANVMAGSSAA